MKLETKLDYNKSGYFLLPLTYIPKNAFKNAHSVFSINSHKPELTNHVFVVFETKKVCIMELEFFSSQRTFEEIEYLGDIAVVTFTLEQFKEDYQLFFEGKYSKFSEKAKNAIGNHFTFKTQGRGGITHNPLYKILYPNKKDRDALAELLLDHNDPPLKEDAEIYSIPDIEVETFRVEKFYQIFK